MGRKIILLSDGTGNSSAKVWRTNVWRTFEALDLSDNDQVACYDDGVGTSSFKPLAILGGAFGFGLRRNVLTLYKFACRNYRDPEDQLYGFGFSRGAFTIRIVMGLIANQGIIKADNETELYSLASAAYRAYRKERYAKSGLKLERPYQYFRNMFGPIYPPIIKNTNVEKIEFIGVWDTVSAYGMPIKEMNDGIHNYIWPIELPDGILNQKVRHAFQALALDEERTTFHPQLWKEEGENLTTTDEVRERKIENERITQVWFSGVHSNVGGGYPDDSLAYIPLVWMMTQARAHGLQFKSDYSDISPAWPPTGAVISDPDTFKNAISKRDKDGRIYDPRKGLGGYYRYGPRKLVPTFYSSSRKEEADEVTVDHAKIHESVFRRINNNAHSYAPIGLPPFYDVVTDNGAIIRPDEFKIAPSTRPFESGNAAAMRAEAQEHVWNEVWKRRFVYFISVVATILLIIFPWISGAQRADEFTSPVRWISDFVRVVGAFLPPFMKVWIDGYARAPISFVVMVAVVVGSLVWGTRIAGRTSGLMNSIWRRTPDAPSGLPTNGLYELRSHPHYQALIKTTTNKIAPVVFAIIFAYLAVALINRFAFNIQDVAGLTCQETANPVSLKVGGTIEKAIPFATSDLCRATGVFVEDNRARYVATIEPGEPWTHFGIPVPVGGFTSIDPPRWYHRIVLSLAVPLRRELFEDWFRIVLRYGGVGGEEVFYEPDLRDPVIQFPIVPTRSGELFVFINDAVTGIPFLYNAPSWFNTGTARLTIRRTR